MTKMPAPSTQIIHAIAYELLRDEIEEHPTKAMHDGDDHTSAADLAHSLLVYSDEMHVTIIDDVHDFEPSDDSTAFNAEVNRIGNDDAFCSGFDLAVELVALIATDPLAKHDISEIIRGARKEYAATVKQCRERVLKERLKARLACRELSAV